ncbi:molecular chaperone IbpA [Ochrobactrum intermedium]|uniref:Molecular chaperone IbpA n=1 Tax=Brucella intermedia TaxID=94625 RepID=A0ABR6AW31_9HYPH|nr:Hsp20 family protein [Brucella intermedia]KAB2692601.1 Hsp20 family protein [Brucella intermedia]MBA8853519.1 molecular chaperone IbpA [Brucella intermedia]MPR64738.1 molecular chaperone Hsp20 [Brucella intermedia]
MRTTFDFSPLFRSSIGFDRLVNALEAASRVESIDNWPPYDIAKTDEDEYRITMAVAGFSEDELSITQEQNMLLVAGSKAPDENTQYLHRGIAGRSFQRRFQLADHVRVEGATLVDGLLTINLRREIPEEMKPRRIAISSQEKTMQIEAASHTNEQIAA